MKKKKAKAGKIPTWKIGKLEGKRFAFSGKIYDGFYKECLAREGGVVRENVADGIDYLIAGPGRGGKPAAPEREAIAQIAAGEPIRILSDEADFFRMILPTPAEVVAMVEAGAEANERWMDLLGHDGPSYVYRGLLEEVFSQCDLAGKDLSGRDLREIWIRNLNIDGADFSGCKFRDAPFRSIKDVCFVGASFERLSLDRATNCEFREAKVAGIKSAAFGDCDFRKVSVVGVADRFHGRGGDWSEMSFSGSLQKCQFSELTLARANFTDTEIHSLRICQCDLRGADFRKAELIHTEFVDCDLTGADFTGARLLACTLSDCDVKDAKGLEVSNPPGTMGSNVKRLVKLAKDSESIEFTIAADLGDVGQLSAQVDLRGEDSEEYGTVDWELAGEPGGEKRGRVFEFEFGVTLEKAFLRMAKEPFSSVVSEVRLRGCPASRKVGIELIEAAMCELGGVPVPTEDDKRAKKASAKTQAANLREKYLKLLGKGGKKNVEAWNAIGVDQLEKAGSFRKASLAKAKLSGIRIAGLDFKGANFSGASLIASSLSAARLQNANFDGANLKKSDLVNANLKGASFVGTNLSGAHFPGVDLSGLDLSTAVLEKGFFEAAAYDEHTKFPPGFVPPSRMVWKGEGVCPAELAALPVVQSKGKIDVDTFIENLGGTVDTSRYTKALKMLKKDTFQLYADVRENSLSGVVKSQTDSSLVYSCRLASDGGFSCCTQNLNACGGLRGQLCKHLLVLIIGLAKGGEIDPSTANAWVAASLLKKPDLDKDAMSETLLRYKGAEAGEVDWRPTETVPEDYYAL